MKVYVVTNEEAGVIMAVCETEERAAEMVSSLNDPAWSHPIYIFEPYEVAA
jgi:hypothetical protein